MHATRWLALGAAAIALAGCGQKTETTTNASGVPVESNAMTDTNMATGNAAPAVAPGQAFANAAAASDAFEIATSNLAAEQAQSPAVKKFAQQMIKAHTDSTAKLKAAASEASPAITPDPALNSEQQQTLASLQAASGTDFDRAYAAAQVDAHEKTLAALKDYAGTGDVPSLKTFAASTTPVVAAHLNMAKALKP